MQTHPPHEIFKLDENEAEKAKNKMLAQLFKGERPDLIPVDERQVQLLEALSEGKRRGWMRNQPCPCGSGKKFKKCHW
jgi:uncharacterized protein YecA (UPF0149 family)